MYNFFVIEQNINDKKIIVDGDNYNHIKNVLRMKKGDEIQICNKQNGDRFLTKISKFESNIIECKVIEKLISNEPTQKITIFQGIPKADKMEYIIQKSVELGVYEIVPVEMKFCVVKINNKEKKISRWQKISEAAAKQSKRNVIPKIKYPINVKQLSDQIEKFELVLLADENEDNITIKNELQKFKSITNIAIIIGSEGGISDEEKEILTNKGAKSVSLGKRILRTETASSAILSMIMYENEL